MKKFLQSFTKQGEQAKSVQERQSFYSRSYSDDDDPDTNVSSNGVKLLPTQQDDNFNSFTSKNSNFRRRVRKQKPASNVYAKVRQELSEAIDLDDIEMFEKILEKSEKFGLTLESRELVEYSNKTLFHEALEKDKRSITNHIAEKCSISYLLDDYPDVVRRESKRKLRSTFAYKRKTCLHLMVEKGNKKVLELVMSRLKKACTIVDDNMNTSWPKLPSFGFCKTQKDLEVFLRATVSFDTKDRRRRTGTAIHLAVVSGQWQTLEILTSHGLSVDDRDSEQETPLMLAVLQNQTESFIELVKLQADVNMQNKQDCSALHLAISESRDHMVKVLIDEESTDLNVERIKNPRWPIEMAAKANNARVVGWLLDRKKGKGAVFRANVHQALLIAASNGFADVISVILERKPKLLNKPDDFGNTPVMLAADSGKLEAVKLLVEMPDIDLDKRNNLGQSVFDLAMKLEDESVLRFLLGRVRFNEALDSFYVHTAVANGKVDRLKLLLADDHPHERLHLLEETSENSVYHTAAAFNSSEVIDLFLDETDDIKDFQNRNYETALHVAVRRNHVESVKSLLNKRVRVDILDGEGQNVLHAAITTRATGIEIVEMLIESFEKVDPTLINEQESNGNTALHLSAMFNKPEVIRKLDVCDPEIENKDGETALHVAARAGSVESVRTLLELFYVDRRANIDRRDELGFTALYRSAENGDRDKYELMLLYGADMGLTSESGPSILHRLVECCRVDPNKADRYANVYRSTVEWSVVWYCRKKGLRCPLANTNQFYLVQLDAVRLLTSDTLYDGCNVMQYAAKKGECDLLKVILETPNVYKFSRNSPLRLEKIQEHFICSVRGSSLSITSDLRAENTKTVQLEQNEGELAKFLDEKSTLPSNAVMYDVTFLIPGHIPDLANHIERSDSLNDGNQQRRRRSSAPPRSSVSCLEYLVENGQESDISEILSTEPFHSLVYNYWTMCRRGYELLMWKHVVYMVLLTYFVIPDNSWIQSRFQNCSTSNVNGSRNESFTPIINDLFSVKIYSFFLVWPALIFTYELITAVHFIVQLNYKKNGSSLRYELLGRLKVGEITSGLMRIPVGLMLFIFDNLSHISTTAFAVSCVAWYVNCVYTSSLQTYLECLAVFLVFGWLHTINYVKGFKDWNALASILKQILIKDLTRFIYIYIFVLISFGYAIHVLMQINSHVRPELSSSSSTIYLTFYQMLSPGNVLDVTENPIYWHADHSSSVSGARVLRAVYATYSILSSVVLMNMLIAMMNSTYSDVKSVRPTAWRFESLRMALWIERNFSFVRKLRLIRFKAKFDKFQNRWFLKRNHGGNVPEPKPNSGVDVILGKLENDTPDKDREMQTRRKSEDFTRKLEEMRTEIDRLNESLCTYENKTARIFNGLNMELKHIHELCLESYHLSRIACRRGPV